MAASKTPAPPNHTDPAPLGRLPAGISVTSRSTRTAYELCHHAAEHSFAPILILGPSGSGRRRLATHALHLAVQAGLVTTTWPASNRHCAVVSVAELWSALCSYGPEADRAPVGVVLESVEKLTAVEHQQLLQILEHDSGTPHRRFRFLATCAAEHAIEPALLVRLGVWTVRLEPIAARAQDIHATILHEVQARQKRSPFEIETKALDLYLGFATSDRAPWPGNFPELSGSLERLFSFAAASGGLDLGVARREVLHLNASWEAADPSRSRVERVLGLAASRDLDRVDRVALEEVLLVCAATPSMAEAGKLLFAKSRERRSTVNDSDRMKKYLARYGLDWARIQHKLNPG